MGQWTPNRTQRNILRAMEHGAALFQKDGSSGYFLESKESRNDPRYFLRTVRYMTVAELIEHGLILDDHFTGQPYSGFYKLRKSSDNCGGRIVTP